MTRIISIQDARQHGLIGASRFGGCEGYCDIPLSELAHIETWTWPQRLRRVSEYLAGLGGQPPEPIVIHRGDGGRWYLRNGNHRLRLARERGAETIPAVITNRTVPFTDYD